MELLTDFNPFRMLAQEWEDLSAHSVNPIFLSYLWLQERWHIYGADYRIWTLVARKNKKSFGVIPRGPSRELLGIRRLMFMGAGELTPNHLDIIAAPEKYEQLFQAFASSLHRCYRAIYLREGKIFWLPGRRRALQTALDDSQPEHLVLGASRRNWRGQLAKMNLGIRNLLINTVRRFLPQETHLAARRILRRLRISI